MSAKTVWEKTKEAFLKIGRKNLVIVASLMLICCAVILNLTLFGGTSENEGYDYSAASGMSGGAVVGSNTDGLSLDALSEADDESYFATSQVNRRRARDEAMEVLQSVVDSESVDAEAKERALSDIKKIAADMESESNIESLIVSKGFEKCVAVVSGGSASIVVKSDELIDTQISQINEIVYEQTGISPENIKIIKK